MSHERYLSEKLLSNKEREFIDAWRVSRRGVYLPAHDCKRAVFVWSGRFVDNETVTMVAPADSRISARKGSIFVGVVSEEERQAAIEDDKDAMEAHVEAGIVHANGLHEALGALMLIKGFPDGHSEYVRQLVYYSEFSSAN